MKNILSLLFGVLCAALLPFAVAAQTSGSGIGSSGGAIFSGVKGLPYSAVSVRETVQTLLDGNKITRISKSLEYRDSEGRTRTEQISQNDIPAEFSSQIPTIRIYDPVARFSYSINSSTKTVYRTALPQINTMPRTFTPIPPPAGYSSKREPIDGTKMIDGFEATGVRTIRSIAPGTIGNEKSLDTVGEYWTATELRVPIFSTSNDPRAGVTTTRLTDIKRDEPDKSLFEIPADYKIIDQTIPQSSPAPTPSNN